MTIDLLTLALSGVLVAGTAVLTIKDIIRTKRERELSRLKTEAKIKSMREQKKKQVRKIKRQKAAIAENMRLQAENKDTNQLIKTVKTVFDKKEA